MKLFLLVITLVISSCGVKDKITGSKDNSDGENDALSSIGGGVSISGSGSATAIPTFANFFKNCRADGNSGVQKTFSYNGSQFVVTTSWYRETNCSGVEVIKEVDTFDVTMTGNDPRNNNIGFVDTTIRSLMVTPVDNDFANGLNNNRTCGKTDWRGGQPNDISGTSCVQNMRVGDRLYTIYQFSGREIRFGTDGDGKQGRSPESRHTILDNEAFILH